MIHDVVIVGGGPAGYTAALYAAQAGLSVLVLEKLAPGGQLATARRIANYPGLSAETDGLELAERMQRQAEALGAATLLEEATALTLSGEPKLVQTRSGVYPARTVILAMGARPRTLGLPGEAALRGHGISYCAACDGALYRGKVVAVVGGGRTAAGDALYLAGLCRSVTLIHRRDRLRAGGPALQALQAAGNVRFLWNTRIAALRYGDRLMGLALENAVTAARHTIAVDGLFVAIGRTPQTSLVAGLLGTDAEGCLLAGEDTRTAIPGVFAAGDVRAKPLRQVVTAAADGAVAAHMAQAFLAEAAGKF